MQFALAVATLTDCKRPKAVVAITDPVLLGAAVSVDVPLRPVIGRNCNAHLQQVQISGLIGAFRPRCDPDGTYSALQTHGSIGMSFCVNKLGETITPPSRAIRACGCPRERAELMNHVPVPMPGSRLPACDEDGTYASKQFWGSIGMTKCVRADGTTVPEFDYSRTIRSCKCPRVRDAAETSGLLGAFKPQCNAFTGEYQPRQTHEGSHFCVDAEGNQIGQAIPLVSAVAPHCKQADSLFAV